MKIRRQIGETSHTLELRGARRIGMLAHKAGSKTPAQSPGERGVDTER